MRKILVGLLSLCILFIALGCTKSNDPIGFRGEITQLEINQQTSILVEGKPEEGVSYDKAYVTIIDKTKIYKGASNKTLAAAELKEGLRVEGVFEGPVAESYPVQGTAKIIRILE